MKAFKNTIIFANYFCVCLGSTILEFLRLLTENVGQEVEPQLPLLYKKLILVIQRQFEYGKDTRWPLRYDKSIFNDNKVIVVDRLIEYYNEYTI